MAVVDDSQAGVFTVDLRGLELPAEARERIANLIQRAVLVEVASLDLAPRYDVAFRRPERIYGPGPTDGIWIQPIGDA